MKKDTEFCYHGGAFFDAIGNEFGSLQKRKTVINADVLDAWFPPAPKIIELLSKHLDWLIRTSPPTSGEGLVKTIAEKRGISQDSILSGAGSSSLMFLALRQWLSSDSRVLLLDPTYGEYEHILKTIIGCRVDRLICKAEDNFCLSSEAMHQALGRGYDFCILVNPNSPTGQHVPREILEQVLVDIPKKTIVWIDETYVEYAGTQQSLEQFAQKQQNIVICKSMSKVYALSGVRVAYICSAPSRILELKKLSPPWSVSLPGQVAAVLALKETEYYEKCYRQTAAFRHEFVEELQKIQRMVIIPSVTNFILCMLNPDSKTAAAVVEKCRENDLFLRDAGPMGSSLGKYALRIAVKDRMTNQRMLSIIGEAINS